MMAKNPDMFLNTVSASVFHWSNAADQGVADVSDVNPANKLDLHRQVWSDACDEGFLVRGKRETHLFLFTQVVKDNEGEVVYSVFVDYNDPTRRRTIRIYND